MTRNKLLVALSFLLLFFTACTKEKSLEYSPGGGNNNTNDIIGNYEFIDLYVKGTSDLELVDGGVKINTITFTEYRTINNAGLVTITKDVITYKELTYAVDTFVKTYYYEDDVVLDSFELPFAAVLPVSTVSSTYKRIGTDSLYYATGQILNAGGGTPTIPTGAKYTLDNDILTITSPFHTTKTEPIQGVPATTTNNGFSVVRMKRR